jgi:hypothetical protein
MNLTPEHRAVIESALRAILMLLVGSGLIKASEAQISEWVLAITALLALAASLYWSKASDRKLNDGNSGNGGDDA